MNKILSDLKWLFKLHFNLRQYFFIKSILKHTYRLKDFLEDKESVNALIYCSFHLSAIVKKIEFSHNNCNVVTGQNGCDFILYIEKKISKRLFLSAFNNHLAEQFILGIVTDNLRVLNEKLINQKYSCGHLLIRTFSPLDIHQLSVYNKDNLKQSYNLSWPFSIVNFPRSEESAGGSNYKFTRDLIEASTYYLFNNLDDCIRRIISSLEDFLDKKQISGRFFKDKVFNLLVAVNYVSNWAPYLNMFYDNILFIYKVRNKIVHERFRMDYNDNWLSKKGLGTLFYIYQTKLNDANTLKYNYSLMMQFVMMDGACLGMSLENFIEGFNKPSNIIKTPLEIEREIFNGLEISAKEKQDLGKKIESYKS